MSDALHENPGGHADIVDKIAKTAKGEDEKVDFLNEFPLGRALGSP